MLEYMNILFVISGPSGSGKTTICRKAVEKDGKLFYSISATTRSMRRGEQHGKDYLFLSKEEFKSMILHGKLLEWAEVYGEFYGTPREPIVQAFKEGKDVIMDIDVQGKRQVERNFHGRVVSIFVLPPSLEELERRLRKRGVEDESKLEYRLEKARTELEYRWEYDYWILNDEIEHALESLLSIIRAERLKAKYLRWKF